MSIYWVIDTKLKVLPQSSIPQDGSPYYLGRSIVPEDSMESAVARLASALEEDHIILAEVSNIVDYESQQWNSEEDEDFETNESYREAKKTGAIAFGCFTSKSSLRMVENRGTATFSGFVAGVWGLTKLITWKFVPERLKVIQSLRIRQLPEFIHPHSLPPQTVDFETRCFLENFRQYKCDGYLPGLSDDGRLLVEKALNNLVSEVRYNTIFSMASLHGFTSSKCNMDSYRSRASQSTMADLGRLVDDLDELDGKDGDEIISACKAWGELRLNQGISLVTDSWHRRYYWRNLGGSHHMAVLCYELQRQGKVWEPEVEICEYNLDASSLAGLCGKVSIFVVMRDERLYGYDKVFEPLPSDLCHDGLKRSLGVALPTRRFPGLPFHTYQLVLVDHSRKYAGIALERLNCAVDAGRVMRFDDFVHAWQSHG